MWFAEVLQRYPRKYITAVGNALQSRNRTNNVYLMSASQQKNIFEGFKWVLKNLEGQLRNKFRFHYRDEQIFVRLVFRGQNLSP